MKPKLKWEYQIFMLGGDGIWQGQRIFTCIEDAQHAVEILLENLPGSRFKIHAEVVR